MTQEKLKVLNFHEWWLAYNETHNLTIGGKEWMAAFAAWHYCELMTQQKAQESAKNFIVQMKAAEKMVIKLSCPSCGSDDLRLLRTLGPFREYCCNKCKQEMTVE